RVLARQDERASRDQRRLLNRLRHDLLAVFPAALDAFPDLTAVSALAFLEHWPTAAAARDQERAAIEAFLRQQFHSQARAAAGECGECHTVAGFVPSRFTLAQHQATRYPLEGAHARARCAGCHGEATPATIEQAGAVLAFAGPRPATLERFRFAATTCPDCHADPHRGDARAYLGADGCRSCHGLERWREVRFDHRRTHFALEGAHAKKGCIDCHRPSEAGKAGREIRLAGAPRECLGCHVDPHFAQFDRGGTPRPCTECHGLEAWAPSHFDHDRDAAFKLEGAHRAVACVGCHARESLGGKSFVRYRPLGSSCTDCHGAEVKP
nr:hypothetical protein [Thermoanaerobaculia bacterium]